MPHNLRYDQSSQSFRQVGMPISANDASLENPDNEYLSLARDAIDISALAPYTIMHKEAGMYTTIIPSLQLKGEYSSRSTHLTSVDEKTVGKAIGDAYCSLVDSAAVNRTYIQPVIARYLLRNKSGEIIYRSAPVLIASENPLQAVTTQLTLSGDGFRITTETTLTAQGFTLSLAANRTTSEAITSLIEDTSVELLVSPQIHPYSPGIAPVHTFGAATTNSRSLIVHTPGWDGSLYPAREDSRFEARIAAILSNLDTCLSPYTAERANALSEITTLHRLLNTTVKEPDARSRMLADFSYPHGFTAETCVSGGNVILWGNITTRRFNGFNPAEFANGTDPNTEATPAAAKVSFADGSSVVTSTVLAHATSSFTPLITYPRGDARQIELRIGTKMVTLPLKTAPGGLWSYYLAPLCQPITPDTETGIFVLPSATPALTNIPDAIGMSSSSNPLQLTAMTRCGGKIIYITPTALPVSSWDFARANFYAFTDAGINAVTVNSGRDSITSARIDSRSVSSEDAIAVTPVGVMAIASDNLVKINSNRVTTLIRSVTADMIGWSQPFGELWCVTKGSTKALIVDADGNKLFTRDTPAILHIRTLPAGLFAADLSGHNWQLSTEVPAVMAMHLVRTARIKPSHRRVLRIVIPISAENAKGEVRIRAGFQSPIYESAEYMETVDTDKAPTLLRLNIDGNLRHPLLATIPTPSRIYYTIEISITALNASISL